MKKFKNIKTGNVLFVTDKAAEIYAASKQYEEIVAKPAKAEKAEKATK